MDASQDSQEVSVDNASVASAEEEEEARAAEVERQRENDEGVLVRIPKDVIWKIQPVSIKEGLTFRQTVMNLTSILVASKAPINKFIFSLSTAYRLNLKYSFSNKIN